jgi:polysaccharide biosynthesis transport protein
LNATSSRQSADRSLFDETGVDVRRYVVALRRSRWLMAGIVIVITGAALMLSLLLPKTYEATSTIVLNTIPGAFGTEDGEAQERRLATLNSLLLSTEVTRRAAEQVPGETSDSISSASESTVDPTSNLIYVTVSDEDPETAAAIANAVAQSSLEVQTERDQEQFEAAAQSVREQIAALEDDPAATDQVAALRPLLTEYDAQAAAPAADLDVAEEAAVPDNPASPRPQRNTVLAFFASVFLAILVALGRDQLRPRIRDPRELSQILGTPLLAGVPFVGRRFGHGKHIGAMAEHEAYQTLRAALELGAPPDTKRLILVCSALHGEGKTTVTARLGIALTQAGHKTLLISADLRWPDLHESFELPVGPGLSDVLRLRARAGVSKDLLTATAHKVAVRGPAGAERRLDVLTSGSKPSDPARLLSSAAPAFFDYVRQFEYDYVLVDGPPMLGSADALSLARETDHVLLVASLERLSADQVIEMRHVMERVNVNVLGLVVIGARGEESPYYLGARRSLFRGISEEEEEEGPRAGLGSR